MNCPSCGASVPEGRFCVECGTPLPSCCPACGGAYLPGAKFCPECGVWLNDGSSTAAPAPVASPEAERRQLTVLFCDLVGSTTLAQRLDPEEMREVLRSYQNAVAGEITRYEGHVAKFMGDGLLAYFGWPRAHEDDAERAVRAGLAIQAVVARLHAPEPLAVRIGIATGPVVVGDLIGKGASQEEAVIGEAPNLAARLQAAAAPGTVVIADSTRRLLGDLFEFTDLGPHALKGFSERVPAWRAVGEGRAESRFEAMHTAELRPLVGREQELALLLERWALARQGEGQVVLLSGEAGIGKSRLVQALRERLRQEPRTSLRYFCSPYHTNSALFPVIAQLERAAGVARNDPPPIRRARVAALLGQAIGEVGEATALVAELLGVPEESLARQELTPQQRRARTFRALLAQLEGLAAQQPVLMVLEDAHWIDPTSLELFGLFVDRIQRLPVLLVVTHRPDFEPPWRRYPHVTHLTLDRLVRAQAQAMVGHLTGGRALPAEVLDPILLKTEGVPLFVEELTKTVLESGLVREDAGGYSLCGPLRPLAIPATLQDSLMARLDRHSSARDVAQIAACIGREFDHTLLAAVAEMPAARLEQAMAELVRGEIIFCRGTPPDATYSFKHALIRDAAYQSLLRSRRRQVHAHLAAALRQRFPAIAGQQREVLAYHLTEAGLTQEAIDAWRAAARQASERSAHREAVSHLRKCLELLTDLPASADRDRLELDIRIDLGAALIVIYGYAAREAEEVYGPAQELARALADPAPLFAVTWGLWLINQTRLRLRTGRVLVQEMLTLAGRASAPELELQAHHAAWTTLFCIPDLAACREHLEEGLAQYDPERHRAHKYLFGGHDPGVCGFGHLAMTKWLLGFPDQARDHVEHGLSLASRLRHSPSLLMMLGMGGYVFRFRGEIEQALCLIEKALQVSIEQGIGPQQAAYARIGRGWARALTGEVERGLGEIREGLERLEETSVQLRRPYQLALLAEVCLLAGRVEEGLAALDDAARNSERWYEPELHRLRGALMLRDAAHQADEAEQCFQRALAVAQAQQARSLELRAATSLARLWAEQGRRTEADDLLTPIYGWFTEGFETADLKDAQALLDELS